MSEIDIKTVERKGLRSILALKGKGMSISINGRALSDLGLINDGRGIHGICTIYGSVNESVRGLSVA